MQKALSVLALAFLFAASCAPSARAQKTESGLLAAWELAQKSDPSTTKFEKTKDRQYHFATKRFPFDGELIARNVIIEDFSAVNQYGINMGAIEVELQGANDDFYRTYAKSYAMWNMTNTLYWDPQAQQWLTSEKYFQQVRSRNPYQGAWPALLSALTGFGSLGLFLAIFLLMIFSLWRYNSKIKLINQRSERTVQISERNSQIAERNSQLAEHNAQLYEQSLKLHEQNAKVFGEILEELKKLNART